MSKRQGMYTIAPPQFRGRISKEFSTIGGWTWNDERMRMIDARYGHTHNPSGVAQELSSKIRGRLFRRKFEGKEYQLTAVTPSFNPRMKHGIITQKTDDLVRAARLHASNLRKMGYNARVIVWKDQAGIYMKRSQLERRIGDEEFEKLQRKWASSRGPSSDLLNTTRSIHKDSLDWVGFGSEWANKRSVYSDNDPGKHHQVAVFNRKRWKRERREREGKRTRPKKTRKVSRPNTPKNRVDFVPEEILKASGQWAVEGMEEYDAMVEANLAMNQGEEIPGRRGEDNALPDDIRERSRTWQQNANVMEFQPRVTALSIRNGFAHAVGNIHFEKSLRPGFEDEIYSIIYPYMDAIDWMEISASDDIDPKAGFMSPRWGRFDETLGQDFMVSPNRDVRGRGQPCPCGSGKKSKSCCRSASTLREARSKSKGTVLIDEIRLMPNERGKGYGRQLITDLHNAGFDIQAATIMPDSINFWKKLGFRTKTFQISRGEAGCRYPCKLHILRNGLARL